MSILHALTNLISCGIVATMKVYAIHRAQLLISLGLKQLSRSLCHVMEPSQSTSSSLARVVPTVEYEKCNPPRPRRIDKSFHGFSIRRRVCGGGKKKKKK